MKPSLPILALLASAMLLVLSVGWMPMYECGGGISARAEVLPACTEAAGLILAFLAARRLRRWWRLAACSLVLLHGLLFPILLRRIHSDVAGQFSTRA